MITYAAKSSRSTYSRYSFKAAIYLAVAALSMLGTTRALAACGNPQPDGTIFLVVPANGEILSSSTNHNCTAGQTCEIVIPGVSFSDTFTASPAPGYAFVGWKDEGATSFCAGETGPCMVDLDPTWSTTDGVGYLEPVFEATEVLALLPDTTRGAFRIHPQAAGAIDTTVTTAPWSLGVLPLLDRYSAGMDVAGTAGDLVLAQLDAPAEFLLVAELATTDVATLSSSVDLTATTDYLQYLRWDIDGTGLQLAQLSSHMLAIGSQAAVEQALDSAAGASGNIEQGPLSANLGPLKSMASPNGFVYGLPALYGPVGTPGNGDFSLNQAEAMFGAFNTNDGSGLLLFKTDNATEFRAKLVLELTEPLTPVVSAGNLVVANLAGMSYEDDIRPLLKTLVLDMNNADYADAVTFGGNKPWLNFQVAGGDAPAIFVNFEFEPGQVAAFNAAHVPPGFEMAPFRVMEGEPLRYIMVVNIYNAAEGGVGGFVSGGRAEWSVFIQCVAPCAETDEPRFLVVEARSTVASVESTAPPPFFFTEAEPALSHELVAGNLVSKAGDNDGNYFTSSIPWPQLPATHVPFDRDFMPANDFIFWANAVADKTQFNSTTLNRDGSVVAAGDFTLTDNSFWGLSGFLKPDPLNVVVYLNQQDIVISPWWNLDATYLDVTPELLAELIGWKSNLYSNVMQSTAGNALRGEAAVLSAPNVSESVPTAHYHFPLTLANANGLLTEVAGPGSYTPKAVELFDDEAAGHYLTLAVYQREGDPCGTRAEWMTYVEGPDLRPESLRLDSITAGACLDTESLMTVAADVSQDIAGSTLTTQIDSPFIQFDATVDLSVPNPVPAGLNWLEATERVCSLNGICDEFYYGGGLVQVGAHRADTVATQITVANTPWDLYITPGTGRAGVRTNATIQTFNPWRNMRSFPALAPAP